MTKIKASKNVSRQRHIVSLQIGTYLWLFASFLSLAEAEPRNFEASQPSQSSIASEPYSRGDSSRSSTSREDSRSWWQEGLMWLPNRLLDLLDIVRLDVGAGPSLGTSLIATRKGQIGYRTFAPFSARLGLFGRQAPFLIETDDEFGIGESYADNPDRNTCRYAIGGSLDTILGVYAAVCPEELLDFFAGLVWLDPEADDNF